MLANIQSHAADPRDMHTRIEFRVLWAVTFPLFLVAAIIGRVLHFGSGSRRGFHQYVSVIREAKTMADCALPFAYMG